MWNRLVASPCSNPRLTLDEALSAYAGAGYKKFEAFTGWAGSSLDYTADPALYKAAVEKHGMEFTSMHLPPVKPGAPETLEQAVAATRFAAAIGAGVVIFKAADRPTYMATAKKYLDAIADTGVTPVLQK